ERLAVGARAPKLLPKRDRSRAPRSGFGGQSHLVPPTLAPAVAAALDEILGRARKGVVWRPKRRDAPIAVAVHAHAEPDLWHPLRVSHGAGPGADHVLFVRPTAFDDEKRVEELSFPIGASARLAPGQRRQRRNYGTHVLAAGDHVAERRFHAP